ncbi:MAG: DUF2092 domain-containing protein [Verrucomicrobiota bacterium]|nr:DUF2092 domain-containing protein [Verrucomicrobiota bacterium]
MKRNLFLAPSVAAAVLVGGTQALVAQTEAPSADALLQRMEKTYGAMKAYSDIASARYRNPDGTDGAQAECKVWFVRPGLFRIDAETRRHPGAPPKREVMWSDGETARSWSTASAVTMRPKIQLAGSKMFGTYAYHIPSLLEAGFGGPRRLHQLASPALNGEETIEGVECYRVKGDWLGDPYEVWIGKADSLVHKIAANYKGYALEEMHRSIVVDETIPTEIFNFAPENESGAPRPKSSPVAPPRARAAESPKKK